MATVIVNLPPITSRSSEKWWPGPPEDRNCAKALIASATFFLASNRFSEMNVERSLNESALFQSRNAVTHDLMASTSSPCLSFPFPLVFRKV